MLFQFQVEELECYPKGICLTCKELVHATINLKLKFEKTSKLLKTWFYSQDIENKQEQNDFLHDNDDVDTTEIDSQEFSKAILANKDQNNAQEVVSPNQQDLLEHKRKKGGTVSRRVRIKQGSAVNTKVEFATGTAPKKKRTYFNVALTKFNHICPFCMVSLQNARDVKKHARTHRTLRKYLRGQRIPVNTRFFSSPRKIETIFKSDEILHKCVQCKKHLHIDSFWKHVAEHNRKKEFHCNKCDRVFRRQNHLKSHMTYAHLDEFPFQCDRCAKRFVIKENFDAHLLTHDTPDALPFKCDKCGQKFANKKHLYYHKFKHTTFGSFSARYKTHRCKRCLKTFENVEELEDHRVQVHNRKKDNIEIKMGPEGSFNCQFCSKIYENAMSLKQHLRKTHGPRNLCSLCGASVLNLKQHMLSHQDKKDPLECHICHRLLASKLTLSRHIRVHTGEKPYKCGFCEKTFKDHYPMRVHERIHKGDKKHVCTICGKGFLEKSYMLKHFKGVHNK